MRIGIIGAGDIGHALAVGFAAAGHQVMLSNSRGPDTLTGLVASIQGDVRAGTVAEAARFGEVVAVAIPLRAIRDLPMTRAVRSLAGRSSAWHQRLVHRRRPRQPQGLP